MIMKTKILLLQSSLVLQDFCILMVNRIETWNIVQEMASNYDSGLTKQEDRIESRKPFLRIRGKIIIEFI
ncbi:hypothetical protein [Pelosinus sp. UFO1]|uniref:hypothetical protein n=1 Tax=Pelosinus sp. UFO1 TaxID=484770 RepID=UPI00056FCC47|nr:hypothetical protein [Pelosinus sp. UFO1]